MRLGNFPFNWCRFISRYFCERFLKKTVFRYDDYSTPNCGPLLGDLYNQVISYTITDYIFDGSDSLYANGIFLPEVIQTSQ